MTTETIEIQDRRYGEALAACPRGEGWRIKTRKPEGYDERAAIKFAETIYGVIWQFNWATPEPWLANFLATND